MSGGNVSGRKPFLLAALFLIIALIAVPLITNISYNSLPSDSTEDVSQGSKIGKHYFSQEETDLINSKIKEADFVNG